MDPSEGANISDKHATKSYMFKVYMFSDFACFEAQTCLLITKAHFYQFGERGSLAFMVKETFL